jgi:SOS response regulatory protein OraA/RecX
MGALGKFLLAAASLAKKGVKESEVLEFAKREFGEVSQLMKAQIRKLYKNKDAPSIKNPDKKPGEVVPFKKDPASGVMASDKASPLMKRLGEGAQMLKSMKQSGMDPTVALTKTLARSILNKKGIKVLERADPIEVLIENFGADVLMDTKNLAEQLLELQRMGKGTKGIDEILEQEGMFNIQINRDAPKGLTQEELRQIKKEVDQEKMFEDFDPTDREPNAEGGINTLMASEPGIMDERDQLSQTMFGKPIDLLTPEEMDILDEEVERLMQKFSSKAREAFRERAADGGRMGYAIGSLPKGIQALVKGINKKFGKGAVKTADEIDQPEKTIRQQIMEFEARNKPDAITMESREILDVPEVPKGFSLSKEKLMAKFPEIDEDFANDMMNMDKDMQGRIIKMLENRRLDPEAYDRLLEKYGDTLQFQSEFDKVVRRKNNNQGGLNYLMGM